MASSIGARPSSGPHPVALTWLVVGLIALGGLTSLAWAVPRLPGDRLGEVALFFLLAAISQRMPVALFRNSSISVGFAIAFAALVYLGPAAAIVVQLGPGLVLCVTPYIKPPQKMLFNATSLPLQSALAGAVYVALGGALDAARLDLALLLPTVVAAVVFVALNTAALATVISLETGSSIRAVWTLNYRWLLPNYVALGVLGLGMGVAARAVGPASLAVFAVPLAMAWYSFKLYMAQTLEVRRRNEELQQTNAQLDLANTRLNQRVTELQALNRIGLSLNGSLDLGDVLGNILESALQVTPAQGAAIALVDPQSGRLAVASSIGLTEPAVAALNAPDSQATRALGPNGELAIERATGALAAAGVGAAISLPLRVGEAVNGVFVLTYASPRDVGADERLLLSTLAQQAATAVHNARLYREIEAGYLSTVQAMVAVVDGREGYRPGHAERVRALAVAAGRRLGLGERDLATLGLAALFHDLGHVGVPEGALAKPGPLTPEEWALVRRHPLLGASILGQVPRMEAVAPVVLQHHERYDGQGYPAGLLGDDASPLAQLLAAADAYEAMTADRPHRPARPPDQAAAELRRLAGSQFSPRAVDALLAALADPAPDHAPAPDLASLLRPSVVTLPAR